MDGYGSKPLSFLHFAQLRNAKGPSGQFLLQLQYVQRQAA